MFIFFFFQAEDGIRDGTVTGVQTCALPISQINAALFRSVDRCRSTQLYDAFRRPPTNHFQNGGLLVSSVVCQYASQSSRSAYSLKQSGKCSSPKRSKTLGSAAFACAMNVAGGW